EFIERIYHQHNSELVLKDHYCDVPGWPPGMPERDAHVFLECFDRGGTFYGAFCDAELIGASVLESRFIGANRDELQLKFLHVSRQYRGTGAGRMLFETSAARAKDLGACKLYISAAPSENTIRFYFSQGCQVTKDIDPALFGLEPEDIHLELVLD
ncbi:MAG: GNAT family N-acetyltransferase, partial [Gammaproteobacteria bacterium]|nr:GNAT family N-acetyltransferase [Gammaproteobacteria bacterium]